jgi:hypothetical protein
MSDYLERTLTKLGFAADVNVLAHGLSADGLEYVVVLDKGIEGCPKYRMPLADLSEAAEVVEVEPEPAESEPEAEPTWPPEFPLPKEIVDEMGLSYLESYGYRDLQAEAKRLGIPANQTKEDLIVAIEEATTDVE